MVRRLSLLFALVTIATFDGSGELAEGLAFSDGQGHPKVYLLDDSRGHEVTITGDGFVLWKGIVPPSREAPNVHTAGAPLLWQQICKVVVKGGPYSATREIDWRKGDVLVIHFSEDTVTLNQTSKPVGFQ